MKDYYKEGVILKKKILLIAFIVSLFLSQNVLGYGIKIIYLSKEPILINTRIGYTTTIVFPYEMDYTVNGNETAFIITSRKSNDTLTITPQRPGAETNLTILDKNKGKYVLILRESDQVPHIDLYDVKPIPSLENIVNVTNQKLDDTNPTIKEIEFENIVSENMGLRITTQKVVKFKELNKTCIWFRIKNITVDKNLNILQDSIYIRKTEKVGTAIMKNKMPLKPNEYIDCYYIFEGTIINNNMVLLMNVNGELYEIEIKDLPFQKEEFEILIDGEIEAYDVMLDDYQK